MSSILETYFHLPESQVLWALFTLLLFVLFSYYFVAKTIHENISSRQDVINKYLRSAESMLLQAQSNEKDYGEVDKLSHRNAAEMLANAEEECSQALRNAILTQKTHIDKYIDDARCYYENEAANVKSRMNDISKELSDFVVQMLMNSRVEHKL